MSADARQQQALDAILCRAVAAGCSLLEPTTPPDLSSGTLLRTEGGALVALTAGHCLTDYGRHSAQVALGYQGCEDSVRGTVQRWWIHPTVDVGLVLVDASRAPEPAALALSTDDVGAPPVGSEDADSVVLVGYPAEIVETEARPRELGLICVHQIEVSEAVRKDAEDGRWRMPWTETQVRGFHASDFAPAKWKAIAERRVAAVEGRVMSLPNPAGMSGGGLWWIESAPTLSGVWHAAAYMTLVGVQSAYQDPEVIIEPVSRWIDWFRATVQEIDG